MDSVRFFLVSRTSSCAQSVTDVLDLEQELFLSDVEFYAMQTRPATSPRHLASRSSFPHSSPLPSVRNEVKILRYATTSPIMHFSGRGYSPICTIKHELKTPTKSCLSICPDLLSP